MALALFVNSSLLVVGADNGERARIFLSTDSDFNINWTQIEIDASEIDRIIHFLEVVRRQADDNGQAGELQGSQSLGAQFRRPLQEPQAGS